ncbi:MAG: hypothetical protein A2Z32_00875 [Chloroflexi bacterium RBG_16_69_14]|nr:MAG: hypothetical protein A2Z32_00875 [Chloroflexi bacterium RBG_16_69_14]
MDPETMVGEYMKELEAAAVRLEPDRRAELIAEVREHIDLALAEAGGSDEAAVHSVLGRLGSPDEIVAAETGGDRPTPGAESPPTRSTVGARRPLSVEARALLLLTVGAVMLPFIGPLFGLWVASASERWTLTQKRTATLIVLALLSMPIALLVPAIAAGELTWVVTSGGFLLPFVPLAGFVAAAYLVVSTSVVMTISRRS